MDPLAESDPRQLGPYKIIARLGSGGMGVVFLGSRGSARVAVKVMRSSFLDSPGLRTRFEREIETLKKIKSSFVARYLDSDIEGDLVWHAVEFVNGPTLKEKIENDGPLDEGDWWALYSQMREALNDVHKLGLVHRDLKPANIILSETGLKLIDFGIAQDSEATSLTSTGMVAGSPAWLSPEQLEGTEVGPGSDLFSAGSILTYAALGRSPWGKETTLTVPVAYKKILNRDFDLEELPPSYKDVVAPLFLEEANKRSFASDPTTQVEEIHREFAVERYEHLEVPEPIVDPGESGIDRASPRIRVPKGSRKLGLTALLITTLVVGGFLFLATATGPLPEAETFDNGDFGLQVRSGDDPRWDGDDRLAWVDVKFETKSNLDVKSVFIKFYDSAGRELFTTGEFGPDDQCNSSFGMILNELPSTAQGSFAGKCSIDEVLQPESLFRVWITFPDGTQTVRLELADEFLNGTAWLSEQGANQVEGPQTNQAKGDEEYSPSCRKPTVSDNFRLRKSHGGNTVQILVDAKANIAGCVGSVEKVVVRVTDLREKPPGYRFYGGPWAPVTCEIGNQILQTGSSLSQTQSWFELALIGSNQFELVCVDEGVFEPWPLEITYVIELENFEFPIQYASSSELSAFRE